MNYREDEDKFRDLLNQEYEWPARYTYKFIVPVAQATAVSALFDSAADISSRQSSGGKYTSLTIHALVQDADEVIAIYQAAAVIPGIISL
ncbi:MAG TPA: DUF493 domain-containing protein [Flammeovirgaceae bacterium]|nr:DUF493 domain-containing protein [Flammeovirgaceae bacterium]